MQNDLNKPETGRFGRRGGADDWRGQADFRSEADGGVRDAGAGQLSSVLCVSLRARQSVATTFGRLQLTGRPSDSVIHPAFHVNRGGL